jgi:hypothetical protein
MKIHFRLHSLASDRREVGGTSIECALLPRAAQAVGAISSVVSVVS